MKNREKGFTHVAALLIVLVTAAIVGAGYYVWHNHHKSTTTTSNQSTGLKSYTNKGVTFTYPSSWTASNGNGASQAIIADATSPAFTSSMVTTPDNPGAKAYFYTQLSNDSVNLDLTDCKGITCKVSAIIPLNNPQFPGAVLAAVTYNGFGTKGMSFVVADSSTKVGDKSVKAITKGNGIYIAAGLYYKLKSTTAGNDSQLAVISNLKTFQSSTQFKELISLIDSIKFN